MIVYPCNRTVRLVLAVGILVLGRALHSQSPALEVSGGYTRAFGSGGYGLGLAFKPISIAIGSVATLRAGAAVSFDRTGVRTNAVIHRVIIACGPSIEIGIREFNPGLLVFGSAGLDYIRNENDEFIGGLINPVPGGTAGPDEDARGAVARGFAEIAELGVEHALSPEFVLAISGTAVHQTLFRSAAPWMYRLKAGIRLSLR